jgi:hypothetical protein
MRGRIVPFTQDLVPAVAAFNRRLAGGQVPWQFPEQPEPEWLPREPGAPAFQEFFLLAEDGVVRGAYCLKRHAVMVGGTRHPAASFHLPLSEGTIDPRFSLVATRLMQDAGKRVPLLFGVGMRGPRSAIARLLTALGWQLRAVPFYFKVLRGGRFARQLRYGRGNPLVRLALAALAGTGLAAVGATAARAVLTRRPHEAETKQVADFGPWADAVWDASASAYSFCAVRTAAVLNLVYPPGSPGVVRLRVGADGGVLGWAVVQDVQLSAHEHFGDMRLGTVVDAFGPPESARAVIHAATAALESRGPEGVDLILSNQSHPAWRSALRASGFIRAPTTFIFGAAPDLHRLIAQSDPGYGRLHLNRGDGDGPLGVSQGLA